MTTTTDDQPTPTVDPVTKVARDLSAIEDLACHLETQAIHKANDRELPGGAAMVALAGVANLEAWTNLVDTALRLAYEAGEEPPELDDEEGFEPPLQTLCFWSEQWRREHGAEYDQRPTIGSEVNFLRYLLGWAWDNEPRWDDFARDIRQARVRLENTLYAGRRVQRTRVPCINDECENKPQLIKTYGDDTQGREDRYKCPACKTRYDEDDYNRAYAKQLQSSGAERYVKIADAIGTLRALGRSERTIRKWLEPPLKHVADWCDHCGAKWRAGKHTECPDCEGKLKPVHKGDADAVVESYCDAVRRQVWIWWPDLWRLHLTTKTRNRAVA